MTATVPAGILAVIRATSPELALTAARGLAAAGVDGIEITFTVPVAGEVIRELSGRVAPPVGAGTVRSLDECRAAAAAGARFVVSPDLDAGVVALAHELGLAAAPGALTPSEVGRCLAAGADAVKVFPIGVMGGAGYLRTLDEPFPGTAWVVSGGVLAEQVRDYVAAGARTVCMGGALLDRAALQAGDVDGVALYASGVLAAARAG